MQIGDKYGHLTLIDDTKKSRKMLFRCDCGNIKYINYQNVRHGKVKTCGKCYNNYRYNDLTGKKFCRLTVIREDHREYKQFPSSDYKTLRHYWLCKCDCGNQVIVEQGALLSGHTKSCGCYQIEQASKAKKIHGQSNTALYRKWNSMMRRCYYHKNKRYHNYGGRGIIVCDEWKGTQGFINFCNWCYQNGYDDSNTSYKNKLTLDRKDANGPYAPWNCRFVNWHVQQNNRTNNKYIFDGREKLTQAQCDAKYGYPIGYVCRKRKSNWPDNAIIYVMRRGLKNVYKVKHGLRFYDEDGFELIIPSQERLQMLIDQEKI